MFIDKGKYFVIEEFEKDGIGTIFTDKTYGDVKEELFLSENKEKNQKKFLKDFGLEKKKFVYGSQTHSANIMDVVEGKIEFAYDTDGYVTARKDVIIFTQYADCLPIYFYSKEKEVIGLCHSGWQGSYKGIAEETLASMIDNYDCRLEEITVALGIGIGPCCYEVGEGFYEMFSGKYPLEILDKVFFRKKNKWYFDNLEFNSEVLTAIGVKNIIKDTRCTHCDDRFHSFRRDGKKSGRNGAFIYFKG